MTRTAALQWTDEELMERVQRDDATAFAALYDRLAPRAFRVALHLLNGDRERAGDAVQDGFVAIWRSRGSYRVGSGRVSAWGLTIVRNRAIDDIRRSARTAVANSENHPERPAPDDVEEMVTDRGSATDLREQLARLPIQQREVVVLAYYGQLSHTEIAAHLGVPVGTVKGRMRLGLARLRAHLV